MVSEIDLIREALRDSVEFGLLLGGINRNATAILTEAARSQFYALWDRVEATTGQRFSRKFPQGDFVYNSSLACSAVLAVGSASGVAPFAYLHALQSAFFLYGKNINDVSVQAEIAVETGITPVAFSSALQKIKAENMTEAAFADARGYGSNALPAILLEHHDGKRQLLAGGYATAEFLAPEIQYWVDNG